MPAPKSFQRPHNLEEDLKVAADRLKRRFAGEVEGSVVEGVVTSTSVEFANARIKDFVGLLVERRSAEMLKTMLVTA